MLKSITNLIDKLLAYIKEVMQNSPDDETINVFLSKANTNLSHISKPCNIILSPVFYWIRIENLPVKNTKQAKKIAPSCFSSHIPDGDYKYLAIKKDDSFMLFAYNEQSIIDSLESSNIDVNLINKIYFAQNEFHNEITSIDDKTCLYKKNDMYLMLPKNLYANLDADMDNLDNIINNISLSQYNISMNFNKGLISEQSLNILSVSFVVIAISLGIEYFLLKGTYKDLSSQERAIISKYKIPKSSLQLRSIKSSLKKKLQNEIKIKENIQNLFDIPLKSGDFFKNIHIIDNRFAMILSLKDIANAEIYKEYLIDYFNISSVNVKDNILSIKGEF